MKKSTLIGLLAISSTITYLIMRSKEGDTTKIEGLDISINPEKLVDGALAFSNINPTTKDGIRQITQNVMRKYYNED